MLFFFSWQINYLYLPTCINLTNSHELRLWIVDKITYFLLKWSWMYFGAERNDEHREGFGPHCEGPITLLSIPRLFAARSWSLTPSLRRFLTVFKTKNASCRGASLIIYSHAGFLDLFWMYCIESMDITFSSWKTNCVESTISCDNVSGRKAVTTAFLSPNTRSPSIYTLKLNGKHFSGPKIFPDIDPSAPQSRSNKTQSNNVFE